SRRSVWSSSQRWPSRPSRRWPATRTGRTAARAPARRPPVRPTTTSSCRQPAGPGSSPVRPRASTSPATTPRTRNRRTRRTANSYSSYVKDVKLDTGHAGVEADGTQDGIDTGNASCLSSDFSYNQTAPNINATVAASGSQTFNGAASLTFANTALNQDACQGASVKLYLVVDNT